MRGEIELTTEISRGRTRGGRGKESEWECDATDFGLTDTSAGRARSGETWGRVREREDGVTRNRADKASG